MSYWLMKSEPDVYSVDDLKRDGTTEWEGVRNYQARNFMTQDMKEGDVVLFYHSNASPSGIAGIGVVSRAAAPDASSWDPQSPYYDPQSSPEKPRWQCVQVAYRKKFKDLISLDALKKDPRLEGLLVLKKGQRLSITPVTKEHFQIIQSLSPLVEE